MTSMNSEYRTLVGAPTKGKSDALKYGVAAGTAMGMVVFALASFSGSEATTSLVAAQAQGVSVQHAPAVLSARVAGQYPGVAANRFGANPLPADSTAAANMASPVLAGDASSAPTLVSRGWMVLAAGATAVAALFLRATRRQGYSALDTNVAVDLGDLTVASSSVAMAATTGLQKFCAHARQSVGVEVRIV